MLMDMRNAIGRVLKEDQAYHHKSTARRFAWTFGVNTLYKYKSLTGEGCKQVLDMIENSRFYCSAPSELNDHADCQPVFGLAKSLEDPAFLEELIDDQKRLANERGVSEEELQRILAQAGRPAAELTSNVQGEVRANLEKVTRIFCLSADGASKRLWPHYANGHKGVALHFRVSTRNIFGQARKVEYSTVRQPVLIPLQYTGDYDEVMKRLTLCKGDDWAPENEYRIILYAGDPPLADPSGRFVSFEPQDLTGITLGLQISDADRSMVLRWVEDRKPTLKVFQAVEAADFAIELQKIG
jgi:hypothetical protein